MEWSLHDAEGDSYIPSVGRFRKGRGTMRYLAALAALMLLLAGCGGEEAPSEEPAEETADTTAVEEPEVGYVEVPAEEAWVMTQENPDLVVVDVSPMYDEGHLPGAVSAPLSSLDSIAAEWDPQGDYLVYCHSREASERGAQTLVDAGFAAVYRLGGEYGGWTDAGLPVSTGAYIEVPADLASRMMDLNPELIVVDVSPMYDQGHLPGALSAPLAELEAAATEWDPAVPYLVYCHSQEASEEGARTLEEMDFDLVYRLQGEYGGWVEAGYAVEAPAEPEAE